MTGNDVTWPLVIGSDLEVSRLTGSHKEVAVNGHKLAYTVRLTSYMAVARRGRQARDRKCHVTSSDRKWPGSALSDRKSPRSGYRRSKTGVYSALDFLQGCSSPEEAVTWQEMTSHDLRLPEVTRKWRHLTGSHLRSGCRRPKTCVYCAFKFLHGCDVQEEALTWQDMTLRDHRRLEVTRKWHHLTGSYL